MQYDALRYDSRGSRSSLTIETANLIAKIIDNTGLKSPPADEKVRSYSAGTASTACFPTAIILATTASVPITRPSVHSCCRWHPRLNLQQVGLAGIENDPVDEPPGPASPAAGRCASSRGDAVTRRSTRSRHPVHLSHRVPAGRARWPGLLHPLHLPRPAAAGHPASAAPGHAM